jgi:hypothetical protein
MTLWDTLMLDSSIPNVVLGSSLSTVVLIPTIVLGSSLSTVVLGSRIPTVVLGSSLSTIVLGSRILTVVLGSKVLSLSGPDCQLTLFSILWRETLSLPQPFVCQIADDTLGRSRKKINTRTAIGHRRIELILNSLLEVER